MLIVLICSNVALLLFARAATRESELVVRSALGASRGRIVMQLFAEALVLGLVASVIGLVTAQFALQKLGVAFLEANLGRLPFWYDLSLSPSTMLYAAGLTVLGAGIAGVLPALKVTRGHGARPEAGNGGRRRLEVRRSVDRGHRHPDRVHGRLPGHRVRGAGGAAADPVLRRRVCGR